MVDTWRGVTVCTCMPDLLDDLAGEADKWAQQAGQPRLLPMQGSYVPYWPGSAWTHVGGGAIDLSILGWSDANVWNLLVAARRRGLDLSKRTPAQGFVLHAHGIVDGCPHLSGINNPINGYAAWQIIEYHEGRNGLAGTARGPDDGPRDFVGITWWDYQRAHPLKPLIPTYEEFDMIVAGTVAKGDNSPDGISGKILLCLPGFPEPLWLTADQWNYVGRVFPYWATLPGSPFYWSQIRDMNTMIQPPTRDIPTTSDMYSIITNVVTTVMRSDEFLKILTSANGGATDPAALQEALRAALVNIINGGLTPAAKGLPDPSVKMATIDLVPRLRGDAGTKPGESIIDLSSVGTDEGGLS